MKKLTTLAFFVLFMIGCSDQSDIFETKSVHESELMTEVPNIQEAKLSYKELNSKNTAQLKSSNKWKQKILDRHLFWGFATVKVVENVKRLIVPFKIKEEAYHKLVDSSKVSYGNASFVIATKIKGGYDFEIMTKLPDFNYLSALEFTEFTGVIIFEDLFGNFKRGFRLEKGGKSFPMTKTEDNRNLRTQEQDCITIEWYSCASVAGNDLGCQYMHSDTYCSGGTGIPTGGLSGNNGYGSIGEDTEGGTSGVWTDSNPGEGVAPYIGKLCPPHNWTTTGAAWTSNVSSLGMTAIKYDANDPRIINIDFSNSCISVPKLNRSKEAIGSIVAFAFNLATQRIDKELESGSLEPLHNIIRSRFIMYIRQNLTTFTPGSTFVPAGGCSGSVASNVANYGC